MLLLELLGIDSVPGVSRYRHTGQPVGRPDEHKIIPRPNKNLWFDNEDMWYNDLRLSKDGDFDLITSEDEEITLAVDRTRDVAYGKWIKSKGKGITFNKPMAITAIVTTNTKFK